MAAQAAAAAPMPSFLAGCWEQQGSDGKWAEECWTAPRGGLMIGSGRAGHGDKVSNWEWMRIERSADGTLTFFASPGGAPAVGFKATAVDAASVTFANPAHDYPQRIRYARTAEGLTAEVSAADGSRLSRWTYRRSGTAD
ncbi:MAG TPA: DUF6265 family protein [Sphingomicrobium sp.]|nr:DUF6265 family protein [Sphingomicrobium sp.]